MCSKKAGEQRCGFSGEKVVYLGFVFSGSENTLIWRPSRYIYNPEPLSLRILPQCVNSVCKTPDFWTRKPILVHMSRLILFIIFRLAGSPRAAWVFGLGEIQRARLFFRTHVIKQDFTKFKKLKKKNWLLSRDFQLRPQFWSDFRKFWFNRTARAYLVYLKLNTFHVTRLFEACIVHVNLLLGENYGAREKKLLVSRDY